MENFIWRKISEKEKEKIKKQAKGILDKFARTLEKVKQEKYEHFEKKSGFREEKEQKNKAGKENKEFQEIFFENAPKKNKDYIIGEKKTW